MSRPHHPLAPFPKIAGVEIRHVPGWRGYAVGDDGSVWTCRRRGRMPSYKNCWSRIYLNKITSGQLVAFFWKKEKRFQKAVHTLVLEAFVGPRPEGMEACHFPDRNPANNSLKNLRWGTHQENMQHRDLHGTTARGSRAGRAKLTEPRVRLIRSLYEIGVMQKDIASRFRVSKTVIGAICRRELWKHVP